MRHGRKQQLARDVAALLVDGRPPGCTCRPSPMVSEKGTHDLPSDNRHTGSLNCPLTILEKERLIAAGFGEHFDPRQQEVYWKIPFSGAASKVVDALLPFLGVVQMYQGDDTYVLKAVFQNDYYEGFQVCWAKVTS